MNGHPPIGGRTSPERLIVSWPQGLVDIMDVKLRLLSQDGAGVGGFGFCLSTRGAEQAHHNIRRMQRPVPHLNRALEGALQVGRLADGKRPLASVLQLMPNPGLLINTRGRIVLANAAAETLLRTGDGLSIDNGGDLQFAAAFPAESAALGEPLRLTRPSGAPPLLVLPVPLPPPAFELWNMLEPARVLMLIIDPAAQWSGKVDSSVSIRVDAGGGARRGSRRRRPQRT